VWGAAFEGEKEGDCGTASVREGGAAWRRKRSCHNLTGYMAGAGGAGRLAPKRGAGGHAFFEGGGQIRCRHQRQPPLLFADLSGRSLWLKSFWSIILRRGRWKGSTPRDGLLARPGGTGADRHGDPGGECDGRLFSAGPFRGRSGGPVIYGGRPGGGRRGENDPRIRSPPDGTLRALIIIVPRAGPTGTIPALTTPFSW